MDTWAEGDILKDAEKMMDQQLMEYMANLVPNCWDEHSTWIRPDEEKRGSNQAPVIVV